MVSSLPACAQPAGIQIAPVIIDLPADRGMGVMRVRNGRAREAAFEIEAFAWTQENGQDVLTPTRALIVAPSVFAVAPRGEQIVRLALAPQARGGAQQQAFRIVMRELPAQAPPATPGPRLVLEMSMPVFITPPGLQPQLTVRRTYDARGRPVLALANRGGAHAALSGAMSLPLAAPLDGLPRYLLAGAEVFAHLPPNAQSVRLLYAAPGAAIPRDEVMNLADPAPLADLR